MTYTQVGILVTKPKGEKVTSTYTKLPFTLNSTNISGNVEDWKQLSA